jgi:hypothetical protein
MSIGLESLNNTLDYDSKSGHFKWKIRAARKIQIGDLAGSILKTKTGGVYRTIKIFHKIYLAHRLAWFMFYGKMPDKAIDHIDGNGLNNAIENLRLVTRKENMQNTKLRVDNTSGHNGVYFHPQRKKWVAYITEDRKMKYLGIYANKQDAIHRRNVENEKLGFHPNHGNR